MFGCVEALDYGACLLVTFGQAFDVPVDDANVYVFLFCVDEVCDGCLEYVCGCPIVTDERNSHFQNVRNGVLFHRFKFEFVFCPAFHVADYVSDGRVNESLVRG